MDPVRPPNPFDLTLNVLGNVPVPILLLQFATEHNGDIAESKLARQIPRYTGRKMNATERFDARFLSYRDTQEGRTMFINTTEMPDREVLNEIAGFHRIRYVMYGKIGIGDRIRLEIHLYDVQSGRELFRKGVDTYATYTLDALDDVCAKTAQATGVELNREERVALFRRDTLLWEAFLYYLLGEDDRYGMGLGIPPPDIAMSAGVLIESLKIDPDFLLAESTLSDMIFEAMEGGLLSPDVAANLLDNAVAVVPDSVSVHYALTLLAVRSGDALSANRHSEILAGLRPDDQELHDEIRVLLEGIA